ncbi:MAG: peptidoglycan-binding domain-containing protein [Candidatus Sungiibacteriota bacterium]
MPKDGPVTGFYGKLTADAVARFQKANGLEVVGDVGPLTRELINSLLDK